MSDSNHRRRSSRPRSIKINKQKVNNYFSEYCESTSIHGLKYLGERDRSCFEKIWWVITITCSLSMCLYLIYLTYRKWERSPVIVSFATKQTPIWQIPFPSVTVCPETKARQSEYNLTEKYELVALNQSISDQERLEFEYVSLICSIDDIELRHKIFTKDAMEFMEQIAPNIESTMAYCEWLGKKYDCKDLFTPIWTDEGVCFTFNMIDREDLYTSNMEFYKNFLMVNESSHWSVIDGYQDDRQNTYPRRALFSGAKAGLSILFVANDIDLDYVCGDSLQGFKVLLTHPAETPRVSQQFFRVPLNQSVVAAVKPDIISTSDALKNYDPDTRKCYFPHEKQLHYFKTYTQQNCEIECLSNYTFHKCGCVDFHMPRDAHKPICGAASTDCMWNAEMTLLSDIIDELLKEEEIAKQNRAHLDIIDHQKLFADIKEGITNLATNGTTKRSVAAGNPKKKHRKCDCLPACTSLSYNIETSQSDWDWYKRFENLKHERNPFQDAPRMYMSMLTVFFKETQFITSERNELYGNTDFLANCGGLLGLFTGFSVISFVEIIYFLTLRCLCNIRMRGQRQAYAPAKTDL